MTLQFAGSFCSLYFCLNITEYVICHRVLSTFTFCNTTSWIKPNVYLSKKNQHMIFWKIIWRGKQWCIVTLYLKTYLFSFSKTTLVPTPFPHPIPCTVTISKGSVSDDDFPQLFWDPYLFTLPRYSLNSLEDRAYTLYPTGGICHSNSELKISRIKLQQGLYKYVRKNQFSFYL